MFNSDEPSFTPHGFSTETRFLPGRGMTKVPKIILSREAYTLMALYVELGDQEVGWLGTAVRLEDGDFRIEKVMLFKQQVSGTETEISTEGLQELSMELLGRGEDGITDWNNMRFWGHSHVRMQTFASGTDENTMIKNRFGSRIGASTFCFQDSGYPWAIRGIFNKMGRAQFSLFLYEEGLRLDDVAWEVDAPTASTPQPEPLPLVEVVASGPVESHLSLGWTPDSLADRSKTPEPIRQLALPASDGVSADRSAVGETGANAPDALAALRATSANAAPGALSANGETSANAAPDALSATGETSADAAPDSLSAVGETSTSAALNATAVDASGAGAAPNAVATSGDGAGVAGGIAAASGDKAEGEEKPKPWLKRVFTRPPRDRRYTPDITAELRRTVEVEFRSKVKPRFSTFRFFGGGEENGNTVVGSGINEGILDGEASGPGTTGDFSGGTGYGGAPKPSLRALTQCPPTSRVAKYGCSCWRCCEIRREESRTVAPTHFEPPQSRDDIYSRRNEPESVLVQLGRFLADWFAK